jgi:two-component system LytT family response regulator
MPPELNEIVALTLPDGLLMLKVSQILYCEADGNYVNLFLSDEQGKITLTRQLKEVETFLPEAWFVRVHHKLLVNKWHIARYLRKEGKLVMVNGSMLDIAVRKRNAFHAHYRVL